MNMDAYQTPIRLGYELLAPSGITGQYDEMAVDCPFVFWHQNRWHMLHVGFDGRGYQTALAHSDDLLHWDKDAPIFSREDGISIAGVWLLKEDHLSSRPTLKKWQGKYWMVYHSYPDAGYEAGPACIGLAFTEDETLRHWTCLPEPILRWQDGAAWEHAGLYKGSLVEHDGRFWLFYNAKDREVWPWHEQIGAAVSDDLVHWERLSENPLVCNTEGGWNAVFCADPYVVRDGNHWLMFYYGYDGRHAQEGLAWSTDLVHWEKLPAPILTHGEAGSLDETHAHKPCVIQANGSLYHFYCAVRPSKSGDPAQNADPTQAGAVSEYRCITAAVSRNALLGREIPVKAESEANSYDGRTGIL